MKELVLKVIRMRKAMLKKGICYTNPLRMGKAIETFEKYSQFYPNASDKGYQVMVKNHFSDFMFLMPGKSHTAFEQLHKELTIHLNK